MAGDQGLSGFEQYLGQGLEAADGGSVFSAEALDNLLSTLGGGEASALDLVSRDSFSSLPNLDPFDGNALHQLSGANLVAHAHAHASASAAPSDPGPSGCYAAARRSPSSHGSGVLHNESSDMASCTGSEARLDNSELDDFLEKVRSVERAFPPPKIGARFSQKSIRVLKEWLSHHPDHPYPKPEDIDLLRHQTGLSKTQICNWLSNARRRGKVSAIRSSSAAVSSSSKTKPVDIPQKPTTRPGTPAPRRAISEMNPMERWVESPPENEPASMFAIARAMATAPDSGNFGEDSPLERRRQDSINQSSASSAPTSISGSGSQALSHSITSLGSQSSNSRRPKTSRKKAKQKQISRKTRIPVGVGQRKFQCTFCTEAFKTKYDWQRHERSLHVPLEKWVCVPFGPRVQNENDEPSCAFCGRSDPDDDHLNLHNFSACTERTQEARSFNRKDHLSQHLRLAHNSKYVDALMKNWKHEVTQLRSRCGFCSAIMDTWDDRVDHLADHFRLGCTMGEWKGNWGFEKHVLDVIENSMPPYLIEADRKTPFPFKASAGPPESPASAYELIKLELVYFMQSFLEQNERLPGTEELQLEGCRVILASEILSSQDVIDPRSWLRDLIMSDDNVVRLAKIRPMRSRRESKLDNLQVMGKTTLFEDCPMEAHLMDFLNAQQQMGSATTVAQLQHEARNIIDRTEANSETPCDIISAWLNRLASASGMWLQSFSIRSGNPVCLDFLAEGLVGNADLLQNSAKGLELGDHTFEQQGVLGGAAADGTLANLDVLQHPDTATAHPGHLNRPFNATGQDVVYPSPIGSNGNDTPLSDSPLPSRQSAEFAPLNQTTHFVHGNQFFLHEANFHRRLERDLHRWVSATVSSKNPNHHIPSDEEIQHYARWIMYNDEDPWNQTPADNTEWLESFKRDAGIFMHHDQAP